MDSLPPTGYGPSRPHRPQCNTVGGPFRYRSALPSQRLPALSQDSFTLQLCWRYAALALIRLAAMRFRRPSCPRLRHAPPVFRSVRVYGGPVAAASVWPLPVGIREHAAYAAIAAGAAV